MTGLPAGSNTPQQTPREKFEALRLEVSRYIDPTWYVKTMMEKHPTKNKAEILADTADLRVCSIGAFDALLTKMDELFVAARALRGSRDWCFEDIDTAWLYTALYTYIHHNTQKCKYKADKQAALKQKAGEHFESIGRRLRWMNTITFNIVHQNLKQKLLHIHYALPSVLQIIRHDDANIVKSLPTGLSQELLDKCRANLRRVSGASDTENEVNRRLRHKLAEQGLFVEQNGSIDDLTGLELDFMLVGGLSIETDGPTHFYHESFRSHEPIHNLKHIAYRESGGIRVPIALSKLPSNEKWRMIDSMINDIVVLAKSSQIAMHLESYKRLMQIHKDVKASAAEVQRKLIDKKDNDRYCQQLAPVFNELMNLDSQIRTHINARVLSKTLRKPKQDQYDAKYKAVQMLRQRPQLHEQANGLNVRVNALYKQLLQNKEDKQRAECEIEAINAPRREMHQALEKTKREFAYFQQELIDIVNKITKYEEKQNHEKIEQYTKNHGIVLGKIRRREAEIANLVYQLRDNKPMIDARRNKLNEQIVFLEKQIDMLQADYDELVPQLQTLNARLQNYETTGDIAKYFQEMGLHSLTAESIAGFNTKLELLQSEYASIRSQQQNNTQMPKQDPNHTSPQSRTGIDPVTARKGRLKTAVADSKGKKDDYLADRRGLTYRYDEQLAAKGASSSSSSSSSNRPPDHRHR